MTMPNNKVGAEAKARWLRAPRAFIREVLINPETGKPFELYPEEERFIRTAFTIRKPLGIEREHPRRYGLVGCLHGCGGAPTTGRP
jgi:hypothetical protein